MENNTIGLDALSDPVGVRVEFRRALGMISGKWKLEILWLLNQRVHRFGELRRAIPGITQHMLTAQLRELEADGLVSRQIFAEVPPRVDYAITPAAQALKPVINAIFAWWAEHGRAASERGDGASIGAA
jgi:DNA-binding HxlR family transcriptional regulator